MTNLNCSECGRFVGKDGFHDVYDGREAGYPLCGQCLRKNPEDRRAPCVAIKEELEENE